MNQDSDSQPRADDRTREEQLVGLAQRGSREAFGELVLRTRRLVEALIVRVTGREELEDLAQECFVCAWTRIRKLREPRSFRTWIGRIAVNLALNADKRRSRRQSREEPSATPAVDTRTPELAPLGREARKLLDAALERVPARRRLAFHLRVGEGLGHSEIAKILGTSIATSRLYVCRAREQLARELAPHRDFLSTLEDAS